jgi:methionyl-tRNA formyltransferase
LRTAYLGTSEFAGTVLEALTASPHRPQLVVAPPDRRAGRGRSLAPPPVVDLARELGLELHQTADVNANGSLRALGDARPEAIAVCAFGQLIREPLLSEFMLLNVHPSLVPRWRGAAPIERAIMAGDERTGVSIMRVTAGLDSGPVALQDETEIRPDDDYGSLAARLAELSGGLLIEALDRLEAGSLEFREQRDSEATYAEKIAPEERRLDPRRSAAELGLRVRALNPQIGTYLELEDGGRLGVREAKRLEAGPPEGAIESDGGRLVLGCAGGALALTTVQPPGKRAMSAEDFLRGHPTPARAV